MIAQLKKLEMQKRAEEMFFHDTQGQAHTA